MIIDEIISDLSADYGSCLSEIKRIYQCDDAEAAGYASFFAELLLNFKSKFPESRELFIVRAPGRVNLIGEHTDYNALPVLPIAIEKNIIIVFSINDDNTVRLYNHDSRFDYREFRIEGETKPYPTGDWGNYIKAGCFWLPSENKKGFNALVYGNIPNASGLSSSSALVVASSLAFLRANGIEIDKPKLADALSKAEQYVGTMGGGMDQAISLLGEEGFTLNIDFHPLEIKKVQIPKGICFVVINSMIRAPKTEAARLKYNRRPIECKIASAVLNKFINKKFSENVIFKFVGDFKKNYYGFSKELFYSMLNEFFVKESYSTEDIVSILGIDEEYFIEHFLKLKDGSILPEPEDGFKIRQRFQYVVEEALRVDEAVKALQNSDVNIFGKMMNESHIGAKELYEISCAELDFLVQRARTNGAIGARLTGAGFGGCMISLLKAEDAPAFIEKMKKSYFSEYLPKSHPEIQIDSSDIEDKIFVCKPCRGSGFLFN